MPIHTYIHTYINTYTHTHLTAERLATELAESLRQGREAHDGGESVSIDADGAALPRGGQFVVGCAAVGGALDRRGEKFLENGPPSARDVSQDLPNWPDDAATTRTMVAHPQGR